jgi:hypothetical protein
MLKGAQIKRRDELARWVKFYFVFPLFSSSPHPFFSSYISPSAVRRESTHTHERTERVRHTHTHTRELSLSSKPLQPLHLIRPRSPILFSIPRLQNRQSRGESLETPGLDSDKCCVYKRSSPLFLVHRITRL